MTHIHNLDLGMVSCYLLQSENGLVLVDAGTKGKETKILEAIRKLSINPKDIDLIILTHAHDDHFGSLKALLHETGASFIMSQIEYDVWSQKIPDEIIPNSLFAKLMLNIVSRFNLTPTPAITPDILVDDEFNLASYGINGSLILTPGHTKGSLSILLDDGRAIIGDHLMAMLPWSKPKMPFLAYDLHQIKTSMNMLIKKGATNFYLSHGKNYDANLIKSAISKY